MAEIKFKQDGIGHFIADNFLRVPVYQRSFAWETSNVQDLFEDIKNSYPEDYFIGTIVVTDKGEYLEIVDGQQRLATINIFFAAVRDLFREIKNFDKSKHIETGYLLKESLRDEDKKQKLILNNMDNEFYLKKIINGENDIEPSKESHKRILDAYNYIKSLVKNKYDNEGINGIYDFVEFIEKNLKIIIVIVSDDVNAFTIFETLNDRGLVLSQTDLIKNYLFGKSDDRFGEVQERWARFTGAIEASENEEEILQFIRNYWSSKNGLTREKELFKDIKNKIRNKHHTITFISNLERNTEIYLAILNPTHPLWKDYPSNCATFIGELKELGLIQNRPLLLAILEKLSGEEVEKSLKLIVSWSVRNLITGVIGKGTLEKQFSDLAKQINDGQITDTIGLKGSAQNLIPTDDQFKKAFEIASVSKSYIARYYLRKLEESYRTTSELSPIQNPEKVNLEHILPENPSNLREDWPDFDTNSHRTYYRRIGNLTLLDKKMNSEIRDGKFYNKKEIYKNSEIVITKILSSCVEWTPQSIEERQNEFAEKAVKIWEI
ncbi:MAG: DUF262 domain-containing HNH endonuclease family protein [Spirochaetota bacterium]